MPTKSYSDQVQDTALDTVWSQWAELGVSGWIRRHTMTAIDIEPLLLATAYLGELDARLLQECLDWCTINARLVSAVRLRRFLTEMLPPVSDAFGSLVATVRRHVRVNWPGTGLPVELSPTGRSGVTDLSRPALLQLRLRAIFGISARSEALRILVLEPSRFMSIAELSTRTGFSKDSLTDALELLARASVVEQVGAANRYQYRLSRAANLAAFTGPSPPASEEWPAAFRLLLRFVIFARTSEKHGRVERAAAIARMMRDIRSDTTWLGLVPTRLATGERLNDDFEGWSLQLLRKWSGAAPAPTQASGSAVYTIHRLETGDWVGTIDEPSHPRRAVQMPEWAGLYTEHPRSDTLVSDDATGAARIAWAVFDEAFRRADTEIGPYWQADPSNQLICREFAEERLRPMRRGSSATFSDEFLRAWYTDRKARLWARLPGATSAP